jgi:DNA-binding XRE family transcriptional regulator
VYNGIERRHRRQKEVEKMTYIEIMDKLPWNKKLVALRVAKELTQEQAAEICGTTRKHLYKWEKGQSYPRKNSRKAIAMAYEVPVEEIFGQV